MKVKIIKASPDKWYHYFVGEVFEVTTNYPVYTYLHNYWIIDEEQDNSAKLILEGDCEIVKENNHCDICKYGIESQNNNLSYCNKIHTNNISPCWKAKEEKSCDTCYFNSNKNMCLHEHHNKSECIKMHYWTWKPKEEKKNNCSKCLNNKKCTITTQSIKDESICSSYKPEFVVGDKLILKQPYALEYVDYFNHCYFEIVRFSNDDSKRFFDPYHEGTSWPLNHFELYNPETYQFKIGDYAQIKEESKKDYFPKLHIRIFQIKEILKNNCFISNEESNYIYALENFELAPIEKVIPYIEEKRKLLLSNPITKPNEEKPKMKKVVKKYSKKSNDQIITFGMLLAKGGCKESLDWVVDEINKLGRTEIEMTLDQFITWLIDNNRSSDASWAEKNFWNKDTNIEEVLVKDIDLQNKIYAFAYGKNIYKYFKLDLVNNLWINISTSRKYSNIDIQTIENHTIYEFENQQEFFKWALEKLNED
jgi:hypothetical protein